MQYKRILGIDYGDVRIGLALSDLMKIIASPFKVISNNGIDQSVDCISKIIRENEVDKVVIGLPVNMDGTEGERAVITRKFAEKIKNNNDVEIIFQDERLSSVEAEDILINANVSRENRKHIIDKLSATIILENYLHKKEKK